MKISFITGNINKFEEAKFVIPELEQKDIDLDEIQSIDPKVVIAHKMEQAKKVIKGLFVVEDISLYVERLNGLPGPLIKWFMKTIGNEGLVKITDSFGNKKAIAKAVIGMSKKDGGIEYFEGSINGTIVDPRGSNGFGWDAIFQPDGQTKTFAEMTTEEKNKISMRKIVFQKLKDFIDNNKQYSF